MQAFTVELFALSSAIGEWRWGIRVEDSKVILEEGGALDALAAVTSAQYAFEERMSMSGSDNEVPDEFVWTAVAASFLRQLRR